MKNLALAALAACLLSGPGISHAHEYYAKHFKVVHPWGEPSRPSDTEAMVFLSFEDMQGDDVLLRASSPAAESVEFRTVVDGKE